MPAHRRSVIMSDQAQRHLKDQFSIDWLDYHGRYDSRLVAAVDVDTGRHFTYREFNDRLNRLANGLRVEYGINNIYDFLAIKMRTAPLKTRIAFACHNHQ